MKKPMYIVKRDAICEPVGESHIIKAIGEAAKPSVYCGTDTGAMNWTANPTPRTAVCKRCKKAFDRMNRLPHAYKQGDKVRDIYTGKVSTVSHSYWQWYAGGDTSDYTVVFEGEGWNKSTNLEPVEAQNQDEVKP